MTVATILNILLQSYDVMVFILRDDISITYTMVHPYYVELSYNRPRGLWKTILHFVIYY